MQINFMDVLFRYMFISSTIWRVYQVKKFSCLYTLYLELLRYSIDVFVGINVFLLFLVSRKICTSLRSYIRVSILKVIKLFTNRSGCISRLNT